MGERPDIPDEVLATVYRAASRLEDAIQKLRHARDDSRIVAGVGEGLVDRVYFVSRRAASGVTALAIREDRARLAKFVALANENGVNGAAVVREIREEIKAYRRGNPSGRYFECRRVAREKEAARIAAPYVQPKIGFNARDKRHGYDVRNRLQLPEISNAREMSAHEYRWYAAKALRTRRAAKAEAERKAAEREAVLASLRVRGKQTPEREAMARRIQGARSLARLSMFRGGGSPQSVRRHYLDAKRRRLASPEKTADRVSECAKDQPWFVGTQVEAGSVVILVSNLRAARKAMGGRTEIEGKPVVIRKAS